MILLQDKQVAKLLEVHRVTIWNMARDKSLNFPQPIRIGKKSARWLQSDIESWVAASAKSKQSHQ